MGPTRSDGFWRSALNWMTGGEEAVTTGEEISEAVPTRNALHLVWQVGALLAITAGSIWLALNDELVQRFSHWGYASSFLISLISNATVILPAPGLAVVLSLGASLNPLLLGIVAGCGSGIGELSGYLGRRDRQRNVSSAPYRFASPPADDPLYHAGSLRPGDYPHAPLRCRRNPGRSNSAAHSPLSTACDHRQDHKARPRRLSRRRVNSSDTLNARLLISISRGSVPPRPPQSMAYRGRSSPADLHPSVAWRIANISIDQILPNPCKRPHF